MADEKIQIEIDLAVSKAVDKRFAELGKKGKKAGKKTGEGFEKGFSKAASSSIAGLKTKLLGLGAVLGSAFAIKGAVQAAAGFEKIETQLQTLTGSAEAAGVVFAELKEFSASTPFRLEDIATASAKLISFGISAGTVKDQVKEIGEVAAGSGSDLGNLALIFGQVQAAGKLTGERLLQLQERAIPIGPAIAKSMGVAESSVRDLVSAGKVTADEFNKAFTSMTVDGGIFAGSLDKQSKTISGIFSTLGDNAKIFQAELGNTFKPAIISGANQLIKIFQELGAAIKANGPEITRTLTSIANTLLVTPAKFWTNFFSGDAVSNIAGITTEISKLEKELSFVEADYAKQKDNAFSKFIGADKESLQSMGNLMAQLTELRNRKKALQDVETPAGETQAVKDQLAAQALEKKIALEKAMKEKAAQDSLAALGMVGLQKQEIINAQLSKELQLIKTAEEAGGITESEASQRRLEAQGNAERQLTAIKTQEATKRAQARKNEIAAELASESTLSNILGNTSKRFSDVAKQFRITSKDVAKSLINGFGNAAGSAFASFGAALVKGENALEAFGKALLASFGSALIQLGTGFILQGVAQSIAGFGSGAPLIAAGSALAVFGGALSAIGGGGGGVSASTGGDTGGGVGNDGGFGDSTAQAEELEEPDTRVAITIQGDVFDSEESGLRIAQILESASLNQNVTVVGEA